MKKQITRGAVLAISGAVLASTLPSLSAMAAANPVCLNARQVQRTEVKDQNTILYHMTDGKVWKNTLKAPCPTLANGDRAYSQKLDITDQICANTQQITVNSTGNVCTLGEFELQK